MCPCCLSCCQSGVSSCLSGREYLWKSWMTKTRWGFSTNLYRGELMRRHYPFFFVLVFPTLYEKNSGRGKRDGYWRGTRGHDRAAVTGGLIHNSSITEILLLRLFLLRLKKWACGRVHPAHRKTLCFQVWLRSESCHCEHLNFCLYIQPWGEKPQMF